MDEKIIREKLKEVEKLLEVKINLVNYDFYCKLLDIHHKLWNLLYFEKNEKENFLVK